MGWVHLQAEKGKKIVAPYGHIRGYLPTYLYLMFTHDYTACSLFSCAAKIFAIEIRFILVLISPHTREYIRDSIVYFTSSIFYYIIIVIVRARGRGYPKQYYITSLHDVCI